ncbi:MAG: hypothetical protein NC038_06680 [Paludibacter sp.]|nr:hypothetical protein [Bacteroidales bacterium]MCM1069586.1 hypothetical protein [Prevotella sp.]MCM1354232.1 hypothetical protein [Bacteroides sp.]MCM1443029.1 hypothetical protein [Muribaculum sp.]MCM1482306.1 hypothetical protein [Paludibacter sp.]
MKRKYGYILFLLLITVICNAEPIIFYTSNLNRYVGTWEYKNDPLKFTIKLKVVEVDSKFIKGQTLIGDYTLIQQGDTISKMGTLPTILHDGNMRVPINANNSCIIAGCTPMDSLLHLAFVDKVLHNDCCQYSYIRLLPDGRIEWHLEADEGIYEVEDGQDPDWMDKFSVPTDCILKKEDKE